MTERLFLAVALNIRHVRLFSTLHQTCCSFLMALTAPSSFLFYTAKRKDAALNAQLSSLLVIIKCIVLLREKMPIRSYLSHYTWLEIALEIIRLLELRVLMGYASFVGSQHWRWIPSFSNRLSVKMVKGAYQGCLLIIINYRWLWVTLKHTESAEIQWEDLDCTHSCTTAKHSWHTALETEWIRLCGYVWIYFSSSQT